MSLSTGTIYVSRDPRDEGRLVRIVRITGSHVQVENTTTHRKTWISKENLRLRWKPAEEKS